MPGWGAKCVAANALQANAIKTARANLMGKIFTNPASGTGFQTAAPNWKVKQTQKTSAAVTFETSVTSSVDLMVR
jgi:calcineurin-like phosphoesterase